MKKKMSNFVYQFKNYHPNMITDPYWCRDQNFRKYFEIRKRHGIEPSVDVKTFYNKDKEQPFYQGIEELNRLVTNVKNVN